MVDTLRLLGRVAIFDPFLDDKEKELTTTERGGNRLCESEA